MIREGTACDKSQVFKEKRADLNSGKEIAACIAEALFSPCALRLIIVK
jgi:hypothetical protein